LIDLSARATDPELLDAGVSEAEALGSLRDLRLVNAVLGGRRALVGAVLPLLEGLPAPSLLDVGCGSADLPAAVAAEAGGQVRVVGLDAKELHLRQAPPSVRCVVADVNSLPFPPASFDVVTASLFLHHFDGAEVARVLGALWSLARRALVVNDLRRALVPYLFGRIVFPWIFRSRVSVADGLLSIRRSFTRDELAAAFGQAGIPGVEIRRSFPYRLLALAVRRP
jgi:SAM-dependent methyltransferase